MVEKIVRLAKVEPGDDVVEIGPGLGSLTLGLALADANVVALEIDRYLIPALEEVVAGRDVDVRNVDVLEFDWDELGPGPWRVVANLPYNIATPLILDLLAGQPKLKHWLVMVQREAGERLVAGPGSRIYGIPSVLTAFWAKARIVGTVAPEVFLPRPRVDSVLVSIERLDPSPFDVDFGALSALVRKAFGQRRKMLRKSLSRIITPEQFEAAGIEPTSRPEELDVTQWAALTRVSGS